MWRLQFHDELKKKKICRGTITKDTLKEEDISQCLRQKGVDMRIGLDIASIAFKKQADQIVLIAGDSEFVPAAKLARREGIDFVLDPMWLTIKDDLSEHIDGLQTQIAKPVSGKLNGHIHIHRRLSGVIKSETTEVNVLEKLGRLLDEGKISSDEFSRMKMKIIG